MRIQCFAALHSFTQTGDVDIQKDQFARYYIDGVRLALARPAGIFTALICTDGQIVYVMTNDWRTAQRLGQTISHDLES